MVDRIVERAVSVIAWTPIAILLVLVPLVFWWLFEPAPLELRYVAPLFSSEPAENAAEAARTSVIAISGGSTVYRFVEYCVRKPFTGTAHRSWINSAMVWHAPDVPTALSRQPGCRSTSIAVEVPTSNPTRSFVYSQTMEIDVNPLRTDRIEYPPIPLTILAPK